jgi:hypothetical protein
MLRCRNKLCQLFMTGPVHVVINTSSGHSVSKHHIGQNNALYALTDWLLIYSRLHLLMYCTFIAVLKVWINITIITCSVAFCFIPFACLCNTWKLSVITLNSRCNCLGHGWVIQSAGARFTQVKCNKPTPVDHHCKCTPVANALCTWVNMERKIGSKAGD